MSGIDFEKYPDYVLHQFACDVAERALLTAWEATDDEPDKRSVNAVAVKRKWIEGRASDEELASARDAARDAVSAWAAVSAAWDAAYAAWAAAYAAWDAAYAAWAAAWAAREAAWAAVRDAEKRWQAEHIEKLNEEYKKSRASILRTLVRRKELLTPAAYDWKSETESILF